MSGEDGRMDSALPLSEESLLNKNGNIAGSEYHIDDEPAPISLFAAKQSKEKSTGKGEAVASKGKPRESGEGVSYFISYALRFVLRLDFELGLQLPSKFQSSKLKIQRCRNVEAKRNALTAS
ncbi:hypothetical protein SADUNF_Sadunf16G0035500 [Salix dunnii]|uniref:Uncharacterized protein n=1 Tax=Salix dunnii TaxID=1413687 RepID=A0A835J7R6_9ROSI|nr:hypothetical protein SADUNF_Sadunf16G0035500 [Salix dunnii]